MYARKSHEYPDTFEFWHSASQLAELKDFPVGREGKIIVTATGSTNLVHVIGNCEFDEDVVGFHTDPDAAFKSLDTDLYAHVMVDGGGDLIKEYRDKANILYLEYDDDTSYRNIIKNSSYLGSHLLRESGLLCISTKFKEDQFKDDKNIYPMVSRYIKEAKATVSLDSKEYFHSYLKAFAKAKIPELKQTTIEKGIDIYKKMENSGLCEGLKEQLINMDESMIEYLIHGFTLLTSYQSELRDKNKIMRPQGMVFNLSPDRCNIQVYGCLHKILNKKYYCDRIYQLPPILPSFVFINSKLFDDAISKETSSKEFTKKYLEDTSHSIRLNTKVLK